MALENNDLTEAEEKALEIDIERMLKMFYLEMRVKGMLTEFKNDYFVWKQLLDVKLTFVIIKTNN